MELRKIETSGPDLFGKATPAKQRRQNGGGLRRKSEPKRLSIKPRSSGSRHVFRPPWCVRSTLSPSVPA
jgi:hypothetical protein